jgi:hypothetical protein
MRAADMKPAMIVTAIGVRVNSVESQARRLVHRCLRPYPSCLSFGR